MTYFQGFLIPVATDRKQDYLDMAIRTEPIFADYGATRTVECWGEDIMAGKTTDIRKAVQAADDESVVFSWILWPDRATQQAAQDKMMADERMKMPADIPFDGKRMIYGGFDIAYDSGDGGKFGYVDGVVASVADGNRTGFVDFAGKMGGHFLKSGATRVVDGWGADVPDGKVTDFKRAVQAKDGETVIFGWVEWPDKPTRDAGMARLMQDPDMAAAQPAWNGPLAIFGGFVPILDTDHR